MNKIAIAQVLYQIKRSEEFSIEYCKSVSDPGALIVFNSAVYGYNYKQFTPRQKQEYVRRQKRNKHSYKGTIPIIDMENDRQVTLRIANMMFFNGVEIDH